MTKTNNTRRRLPVAITFDLEGRTVTRLVVKKARSIEPAALTVYITAQGDRVRKIDVLAFTD